MNATLNAALTAPSGAAFWGQPPATDASAVDFTTTASAAATPATVDASVGHLPIVSPSLTGANNPFMQTVPMHPHFHVGTAVSPTTTTGTAAELATPLSVEAGRVQADLQSPTLNTDRTALTRDLTTLENDASTPVQPGINTEAQNILQHGFNTSTTPNWSDNATGLEEAASAVHLGSMPGDAALKSDVDTAVGYMKDPGLSGSATEQSALKMTLNDIVNLSGQAQSPALAAWASSFGSHVLTSNAPISTAAAAQDTQGLNAAAQSDGVTITPPQTTPVAA